MARVFANQLITALVRYRLPNLWVPMRVYRYPPPRQPAFCEAATLTLQVFGGFVVVNRELVCRLSSTAAEAGALIGCSINTAAVLRKRVGVRAL